MIAAWVLMKVVVALGRMLCRRFLRSRVTLCLCVRSQPTTDSAVSATSNTVMSATARVLLRLFQLRRSLRRSVSIQTITPAAATCC